MISTKQYSTFINLITKLNPEQFMGLCTVLCVSTDVETDSKKTSRNFDDILSDVLDNFEKLPRKSRKDLIHVLTLATK